jgi:hypothetical protein
MAFGQLKRVGFKKKKKKKKDHPAIKRRQFFLSNPCLCLRNKKAKAVCSRPVIPYSIVLYKVREAFKTKGVASIVILLGGLGCTL